MSLRSRPIPASILLVALALLAAYDANSDKATAASIPITGDPAPDFASLDEMMTSLMEKWNIPGGALAVVKDGRLVFAHGYGWADRDARKTVQPNSLFRIASISKPITAAAILALVERGKLSLDAKILDSIDAPGAPTDPRWRQITIRQLLQHTAGFDRSASFDPMFRSNEIAKATGTKPPAGQRAIIRYMLDRQLDFDPGTKMAYSNFGYCLLGRVIEHVTGKPYGEATQELVLRPAGIARMRLGRTQVSNRLPGEVCYYMPGNEMCRSVLPQVRNLVPCPYGEFYLGALDSHGGWVASATDLVRFAAALDGHRKPSLLKPATVRLLESRPPPPLPPDSDAYYGLGWMVRPVGRNANWWHAGSLPGTMTLLVRTHHGLVWAALFNLRPYDDQNFQSSLDTGIWEAVQKVPTWPEHDLFEP
jgi:CubicO group peptidase (beta-lactamase class C family)